MPNCAGKKKSMLNIDWILTVQLMQKCYEITCLFALQAFVIKQLLNLWVKALNLHKCASLAVTPPHVYTQ